MDEVYFFKNQEEGKAKRCTVDLVTMSFILIADRLNAFVFRQEMDLKTCKYKPESINNFMRYFTDND